jgi:hypothetical protein
MNGRRILLAVGVVLGLVAGSLAVLVRRGAPNDAEILRPARRKRPSRTPASPARLAAETAASVGRTSSGSDRQLADGIWIRGRVQIPAGTPSDDRIEVSAHVLSLEDDGGAVAAVDADGRFLVQFPEDAEDGWLELKSKYLFLEEELDLDLTNPPQEAVLEPQLGGCIRGRLVAAHAADDLVIPRIELFAEKGAGSAGLILRVPKVDPDLAFEMTAVPARSDYVLSVAPIDFVPAHRAVEVRPGATTDVRIDLHACARVSGRVVDEEGKPVEGAQISWIGTKERWFTDWVRADAGTAANGVFSMRSVPPGDLALHVEKRGFLSERIELGECGEGRVLEGVEIQLHSGAILGVVQWPDGTPAPSCRVRLAPMSFLPLFDADQRLPLGEFHDSFGARFSFVVASKGPFHLTAQTESTDAGGRSAAGGVAIVDGVRPGDAPIKVVLEPANTVHGRVVDDLGQPVASFTVRAIRIGSPRFSRGVDTVESRFHGDDGAFALGGIASGAWTLEAGVIGVDGPPSESVEVPTTATLVLVVPRSAVIVGRVLDPMGAPVPLAEVVPDQGIRTTTDRAGRFRLSNVQPGAIRVNAGTKDWARSETVQVDARPGETTSNVDLRLRRGGKISGTVFDAAGRRESGRVLSIRSEEGECFSTERSDPSGHFESQCLLPGIYAIQRESRGQDYSLSELEDSEPNVSVTVLEDEVSTVVIGRP